MMDVIVESAREIMNESTEVLVERVAKGWRAGNGMAAFKHDLAQARLQVPVLEQVIRELLAAEKSSEIKLLLDEEIRRSEHSTPVVFLGQILEYRLEQQAGRERLNEGQ